jgi:hypothetical protein
MPLHDRERRLVAELRRSVAAAVLAVPALNVLRLAGELHDLVAEIMLECVASGSPEEVPTAMSTLRLLS